MNQETDMTDELQRIVYVKPAYDCIGVQPCVHGSPKCIPGTGGSHGRHNAEIHFTLRGTDAEITFVTGTGWDLPSVPLHYRCARNEHHPQGKFVEMHTARPRYAEQDRSDPRPDGSCANWADCYVDAGYRMADEPARLLVEQGSDAVWTWLEGEYARVVAEMDAVVLPVVQCQGSKHCVEPVRTGALDGLNLCPEHRASFEAWVRAQEAGAP